jgi:hypothetical protein
MARRWNFPQGFVEPCHPTRADKPPSGSDWVHEFKHDGYRLIVRPDGIPAIASAAMVKLIQKDTPAPSKRLPNPSY